EDHAQIKRRIVRMRVRQITSAKQFGFSSPVCFASSQGRPLRMRTALKTSLALLCLVGSLDMTSAAETLPDAIAAPGLTPVLTAHAQGQQIYECKAGADGKLVWTFREPQASLTADGKLIGKHYAGPTWELEGGSAVVGKAAGNAPGKTANDIAWL